MAMNHVGSWLDFPDMDDPAAPRQTKNGTVVHFFFFLCAGQGNTEIHSGTWQNALQWGR